MDTSLESVRSPGSARTTNAGADDSTSRARVKPPARRLSPPGVRRLNGQRFPGRRQPGNIAALSTSVGLFMRSHYCGQVNEKLVGQEVTVAGWVHRRRDHGGVIFVDLRDREGLLQIVFDPDNQAQFSEAEKLRNEFVVQVRGLVRERPAGTANANLASGKVELLARELVTLNRSEPLPFQLDEHVSEEVRLKYRYIDLRREDMAQAPAPAPQDHARHAPLPRRRRASSTSRRRCSPRPRPKARATTWCPRARTPGKFFALPQSPQIFKQLLMVAGFDRYYQIVKCFRDEDLRAERQPEFTQLDIETSFLSQEQIMQMMEALTRHIFKDAHRRRARQSVPAHELRRKPCALTAPTSPTCATRSSWSTSTTWSPAATSRCSPVRRRIPKGRVAALRVPGGGAHAALADRRLHRVCRALRRQGPGVHQGQREGQGQGRPAVAHREIPERRRGQGHSRAHRRRGRRPHLLRRRQRQGGQRRAGRAAPEGGRRT